LQVSTQNACQSDLFSLCVHFKAQKNLNETGAQTGAPYVRSVGVHGLTPFPST
jgi:hypothetical protein